VPPFAFASARVPRERATAEQARTAARDDRRMRHAEAAEPRRRTPHKVRIVPMKTEFQDVSETQKKITIEIPSDIVDAEIDRVAKGYSKQARLPGFRPGKVPSNIIKQRFREQIHHDVMHDLIPRAVEEALQERGIEPVATPDIKDVSLREGEPLKF